MNQILNVIVHLDNLIWITEKSIITFFIITSKS